MGTGIGDWEDEGDRKWLRWWDEQGNLLPWGSELAQQEHDRAEEECDRLYVTPLSGDKYQ